VATLAIFNGIMPAISQSQDTIGAAAAAASDRIGSRVEIIQVAANGNQVDAWLKNIGTANISDIQHGDVFLSSGSNTTLLAYGGPTAPFWESAFTGSDSEWVPASTIHITITLSSPLAPGTYSLKFVTPNGVSDETSFSA
jgi:hypothetical protein